MGIRVIVPFLILLSLLSSFVPSSPLCKGLVRLSTPVSLLAFCRLLRRHVSWVLLTCLCHILPLPLRYTLLIVLHMPWVTPPMLGLARCLSRQSPPCSQSTPLCSPNQSTRFSVRASILSIVFPCVRRMQILLNVRFTRYLLRS